MWPKRLDVGIHTCEDETIARCVKRNIRREKDLEGLRRELMAERPLALRNEFGKFAEGENAFVDRAFVALREGNLEPDSYGLRVLKTTEGGTQIILVHLKGEIDPKAKSLDESRGAAIAAYQDHLEDMWISRASWQVSTPHQSRSAAQSRGPRRPFGVGCVAAYPLGLRRMGAVRSHWGGRSCQGVWRGDDLGQPFGCGAGRLEFEDSAAYAERVLQSWMREQVMLDAARTHLKDELPGLEQALEAYRRSLLVNTL